MNTYAIPVDLVVQTLVAIVVAIIAIGGYMVTWAFADTKFKVEVTTRLSHLEELIAIHDEYRKSHDHHAMQIEMLEERLENHINGHNGGFGC